jgi:hypothetical protein
VLTLYGVAVTAENARHIVATLILDGSPDALAAAEMFGNDYGQKGRDGLDAEHWGRC